MHGQESDQCERGGEEGDLAPWPRLRPDDSGRRHQSGGRGQVQCDEGDDAAGHSSTPRPLSPNAPPPNGGRTNGARPTPPCSPRRPATPPPAPPPPLVPAPA